MERKTVLNLNFSQFYFPPMISLARFSTSGFGLCFLNWYGFFQGHCSLGSPASIHFTHLIACTNSVLNRPGFPSLGLLAALLFPISYHHALFALESQYVPLHSRRRDVPMLHPCSSLWCPSLIQLPLLALALAQFFEFPSPLLILEERGQ